MEQPVEDDDKAVAGDVVMDDDEVVEAGDGDHRLEVALRVERHHICIWQHPPC